MNILDYIFKDYKDSIVIDESENVHVYLNDIPYDTIEYFEYLFDYIDDTGYIEYGFISSDRYKRMKQIKLTIPDNLEDLDISYIRRPYYRLRGKPVTLDQAFEVISRTDNWLGDIDKIQDHPDFLISLNFDNWLINKNHIPRGYGWIHTDGLIGTNAITQKYPTISEFIAEWFMYKLEFPYLDIVIALTDWDEINPRYWDTNDKENIHSTTYNTDFYKDIKLGISTQGNQLKILTAKETIPLYKEYNSKYGEPQERFIPDYYEKNNIDQISITYLKRCIERYNLKADEILEKEPNRWE